MSKVIQGFQDLVRWTFDLFPYSWRATHSEQLDDGTYMTHYTWFGDTLNFVQDLVFMIPAHGHGAALTTFFVYCALEIFLLFFFMKRAVRKKQGYA